MNLIVIMELLFAMVTGLSFVGCKQKQEASISIKEAYAGKFVVGTALNTQQSSGIDTAAIQVVLHNFNAITAENCMKSEVIHPAKNRYDFSQSDMFVDFGLKNNLFIVGHTLVWHSQTAPWMFVDGKGSYVCRDTLINRMKSHIYTVVGRYKGKVNGWDVVNEAIDDSAGLRNSLWMKIIGSDYIELAFKYAHEADPDAELYLNDYNLYQPGKRNVAIKLAKSIQEKGLRIDAIGEQAHYGLNPNVVTALESSIKAFAETGLKVVITELDVSVLPFPTKKITAEVSLEYENKPGFNPFANAMPDSISLKQSEMYQSLFRLFLKQKNTIERVTFWGVNDEQSWRNDWPIKGRTDYALLFDRDNKPKTCVHELIGIAATDGQKEISFQKN